MAMFSIPFAVIKKILFLPIITMESKLTREAFTMKTVLIFSVDRQLSQDLNTLPASAEIQVIVEIILKLQVKDREK
jgi:hypothetical protein